MSIQSVGFIWNFVFKIKCPDRSIKYNSLSYQEIMTDCPTDQPTKGLPLRLSISISISLSLSLLSLIRILNFGEYTACYCHQNPFYQEASWAESPKWFYWKNILCLKQVEFTNFHQGSWKFISIKRNKTNKK